MNRPSSEGVMAFRAEIDDFGAFYEATYPAAFRTAFGILGDRGLADDVVQDAYVSAYRDRDRFRGDAPARAWLLRIVVNRAISSVRGPRPKVVTLDLATAPDPADPDDAPARITASLTLEEALRQLAPRDRAAVLPRPGLRRDWRDPWHECEQRRRDPASKPRAPAPGARGQRGPRASRGGIPCLSSVSTSSCGRS